MENNLQDLSWKEIKRLIAYDNKLNEIHKTLENYIDLGKSNSSASLPANIQTSVNEVKVELLDNGKENFIKESLKYFAAAENEYIKLTKTEKNKIFKIIEDNYEIKFSKAIQILQKTRDDIEKFNEFNSKEFNSLKTINATRRELRFYINRRDRQYCKKET